MNPREGAAKPSVNEGSTAPASARSEEKLELLLSTAARLMAELGYAQTSIRKVASETGLSLAGMYYYFENKEDLLFQIQHRTFSALLAEQERALEEDGTPEQKLRRLLRNHLAYFTAHGDELKVCTFELHSLQDARYRTIESLRRRYFRCLAGVISEVFGPAAPGATARAAVPGAASGATAGAAIRADREALIRHHTLFIFGMLNWIFMWFDPERDAPVERLGDEMLALVMRGLAGARVRGS
jgi:AcrR family transcriptional regulator